MQSFSDREQHMIEKIRLLPPHQISEVEDFIEFLTQRHRVEPTASEVAQMSEPAFAKIWDNPEDAAYDSL